jgi:putative ABC transport system permease protein
MTPRADLDDELRFHVDARFDEYIAAGLDEQTARAEAAKRFGDVQRVRAQCVAIDSRWSREQNMSELLHRVSADLRYAARQLWRTPSITIAAILCFALGIGANTSIFSVVDAVLFRPLPFLHPDRLVLLGEELPDFGGGNSGTISPPEYVDYKTLNGRVFQASAIFENTWLVLTGGGDPERVQGTMVSPSLFDVLGVRPAHGRAFQTGEDDLSAPDVAVLSDALWRRRYGADPSIVGRSVTIDGRSFRIVGIMPPHFAFPLAGLESGIGDVFVPYKITPAIQRIRGDSYSASFIARIAPNVTLEQAQSAASEMARRFPQLYPSIYGRRHTTLAQLFPLRDRAVGQVKSSLLLLLGAVGLILLIACINVSSLLLARAAARQRELAMRRALGASRGRLLQQFICEGLLLVTVGSALGVAFSVWGARALAARAPGALLRGYDVSVDTRMLLFTVAITVVTAVVVSLVPAFQQSDRGLASTLRDEGRGASGGVARQRGRRTLVVTEIALALIVATGAALMVRSLLNARTADPGFNPEHLISFRIALPDYRYRTWAEVHQAEVTLTARLRNLPGARGASAATNVPMAGTWRIAVALEGKDLPKTPIVLNTLVFPGYFETLEIPMRAGATFAGSESNDTPAVAIINESFAKRYFAGENPIGQRLKWGSASSPSPWATVVGVSADVRQVSLDRPTEPAVYLPAFQKDTGQLLGIVRNMAYVVRTQAAPEQLFDAVRQAVHEGDPDLMPIDLRTQDDVVSLSVAARQFNTALLSGFALLALVLAAVGIYGLMAFAIVQRTREIGIRLAIGATPRNVLALVVGQGARLGATGVSLGLVGALALTRVMRSLLFDVSPFDLSAFAGAAMIVLCVAAVASYLPARRASRIDPQRAINSE